MPKILLVVMALLTVLETSGSISGIVASSDQDWTSSPSIALSGAEIKLLDSATLEIAKRTSTDSSGAFHFDDVKPGGYFVTINEKGMFRERVAAVSVKSGQEANIGKQNLRLSQIISVFTPLDENGKFPGHRRRS